MLAIDVGNTRLKWGLWKHNDLIQKGAFNYHPEQLETELSHYLVSLGPQEDVCICCVASEQVRLSIKQWFQLQWNSVVSFVESQGELMGLHNGYTNPEQMGADRWVAMLAAFIKYQQAVCVIDCGTAVTMDLVNAQGRHLGGLIMPGLDLMQNALYTGTQRIKEAKGSVHELGINTADAVVSGCHQLLSEGLRGLVAKHRVTVGGDLLCVVTGGNAELLIQQDQFDCCHDPDLILYGLNVISNIKK